MSNPIIQRELIGMLRRRRALFIMAGLAAALALLVVLRWPDDARATLKFGYEVYVSAPDEAGRLTRAIQENQRRAQQKTEARPPAVGPAARQVKAPVNLVTGIEQDSARISVGLRAESLPERNTVRLALAADARAPGARLDETTLRALAAGETAAGREIRIVEIREVPLGESASKQVLRIFGYGLMVGLLLLTPAFPATSIVRERQSGTLALLLNSPMSARDIMLGKMAGVAGFVLVLLLMSLPAAAACYAMGGVSLTGELLPMYLVLLLMSLQYSALGLLVSAMSNGTDTALRATYGMVLALAVLTLGPYEFLQAVPALKLDTFGIVVNVEGWPRLVMDWLRSFSPVAAMMEAMGQGDVGGRGLISAGGVVLRYSVLAVGSIAFMSWWLTHRLNGWMLDRPRSAGRVTDEQSRGVQAYRRIMYLWFFDPQRRTGLIGPLSNPVMVKEYRSRRFGRKNWMMRLLLGCVIASLAVAFGTSLIIGNVSEQQQEGPAVMGSMLVLLEMALLVLLTPSLASGLISSERESGGWQLLQMTPLSPWTIITGKLMSVLLTLLLVLVATLPGYVVIIWISPAYGSRVLEVILSLVLTATFVLLSSAAISSLFKRTAVATAVSYSFTVTICAGTLLIWMAEGAPFSTRTVEWVLRFNPLAAALQLIEAPGFRDYRLTPISWWIIGGGCVLALLVLLGRTWRLSRPS